MSALPVPILDTRSYQDLVDEALARIPVHNPEWTNFNRSDPGVTLVELFAFLTESLLYRANQIPERNRRAFLALLGVPLQPASPARGIVTLRNERGERRTMTLGRGLEVRAGTVPFRSGLGLDALPVEGLVFFKRVIEDPREELVELYRQLYASYREGEEAPADIELYETVPLRAGDLGGVDLVGETVDRSLWIALMLREADQPRSAEDREAILAEVREELANRTLSIGLVPAPPEPEAELRPGGRLVPSRPADIEVLLPRVDPSGLLPEDDDARIAAYRPLDVRTSVNVLEEPGIVQATLPGASELGLWANVDPLEAGVGDFPPALEDTRLADRVVTWVRVRAGAGAQARLLWAGINAVTISQRAEVVNEVLPVGTGEPDQVVRLARTPVIPESVAIRITSRGSTEEWERIDDLSTAGPEVPVPDLRRPPGARPLAPRPSKVYAADPATGEVRFGDGLRGARPPADAQIRADYAYGAGRAGNVGRGEVKTSPTLPAGFVVSNPVRTWGGAEGETVVEGEKQIARFLQHRDRLVSEEDFEAIVNRAPGVDIGRVDVLPAFSPELPSSAPGDAAGAVTVMLVPRYDAARPNAPAPDQAFLDAVCRYIDPRRLVTTEIFLRPPSYVPIWISVGIDIEAGRSFAEIRDAVSGALAVYLSPLRRELAVARVGTALGDDTTYPHAETGWPLGKEVVALELQAVASRVEGVRLVRGLLVGKSTGGPIDVPMRGLELPRVEAVVVTAGEPLSLDRVRGLQPAEDRTPRNVVPVPIVPETC
jgi:hypothetical protein